MTEPHVPTPPILHDTCKISYPPHLLPPHSIQPTYVEYSCLLSFSISTWRWPFKGPKHVVDLYVVNSIYISTTNKVVLDKDIHLILVLSG